MRHEYDLRLELSALQVNSRHHQSCHFKKAKQNKTDDRDKYSDEQQHSHNQPVIYGSVSVCKSTGKTHKTSKQVCMQTNKKRTLTNRHQFNRHNQLGNRCKGDQREQNKPPKKKKKIQEEQTKKEDHHNLRNGRARIQELEEVIEQNKTCQSVI